MRFSLMSYILPIWHSVFYTQSNMFWEIERERESEFGCGPRKWRDRERENGTVFLLRLMCSLNDFSSLISSVRDDGGVRLL